MFTTEQIVAAVTSEESIERIDLLLQREDVKGMLLKHKITAADIRQRLPELAPSELRNLANQIEDMPETDSSNLVALAPQSFDLIVRADRLHRYLDLILRSTSCLSTAT